MVPPFERPLQFRLVILKPLSTVVVPVIARLVEGVDELMPTLPFWSMVKGSFVVPNVEVAILKKSEFWVI